MKLCPKCGTEHHKNGTFCSRSCANSKPQTEESNEKRRKTILSNPNKNHGDTLRTKSAQMALAEKRLNRAKILLDLPWSELNMPEKRKRIAIEQNFKCSECKIDQIWNGKPLRFELDHITGDNSNDDRENLRFLCPNCHSQTATYKVGNNKNPGKITYTDEEIIQALLSSTSGYQAMKSIGMNPHGGNYFRLRKIIKDRNLNLQYTV